jgi:diaminopimelate epimerase
VSSAIAASRRGLVQQPVAVKVSSGMVLTVSWIDEGDIATDIQLAGTARTVARGEILPEALH